MVTRSPAWQTDDNARSTTSVRFEMKRRRSEGDGRNDGSGWAGSEQAEVRRHRRDSDALLRGRRRRAAGAAARRPVQLRLLTGCLEPGAADIGEVLPRL